jgi:hypothetical protein
MCGPRPQPYLAAMTTPTLLSYEATQAHTADLVRAAGRARQGRRPRRVRSSGPSRRTTLARRLRLA